MKQRRVPLVSAHDGRGLSQRTAYYAYWGRILGQQSGRSCGHRCSDQMLCINTRDLSDKQRHDNTKNNIMKNLPGWDTSALLFEAHQSRRQHCCCLQVITLARAAAEAAESDIVRAECFLYMARAQHAKGMFRDASAQYAQVRAWLLGHMHEIVTCSLAFLSFISSCMY